MNRVGCHSTYRRERTAHDEPNGVLLAKTAAERYGALRDRIRTLYPHRVPCIERFDEDDVLWLRGLASSGRG